MRRAIEFLAFATAVMIFVISIAIAVELTFGPSACEKSWPNSKYDFPAGCLVKTDNGYVTERSVVIKLGSEHD